MLMRYTGQGIGHKNTHSRTAAFCEDVTAAYGSWVAEIEPEVVDDNAEEDEPDGEDDVEEDDESEVGPQGEDDSDWEDNRLSDEEEEAPGFDENDDVLAEEDEYGYTPL